jgi:hypothetical protein
MRFKLKFSDEAKINLQGLEADKSKAHVLKQVRKTLGLMEVNLRHPSLNTHKFDSIKSLLGEVFELAISRNPGPSGPSEAIHANTHQNPYLAKNPEALQGRVLQSYAQNNTPGAYRIFWAYGPGRSEVTIIAIIPHP